MLQHLAASVNSASTSCPFGNSPSAPLFNNGYAPASKLHKRRQRPCGHNVNRVCEVFGEIRNANVMDIGRTRRWPSPPRAGRPLSCRCFRPDAPVHPAVSASAQAITSPGNPPPEPRSAQTSRLRRQRQKLKRVGDMPRPKRRERGAAIRLMRCCHVQQQRRQSDRAAPMFHVKQASAPARALRSAARSGDRATSRISRRRLPAAAGADAPPAASAPPA